MTKIKVKIDKSGLAKKTKEILDKAVSDQVLNEIGETLVRLNQKNIRVGNDGKGKKLPDLSSHWINRKSKLAKKTPTHLGYSINRSNATFTGQLIDGIIYKINRSLKSVVIDFNEEKRSRYINEKGLAVGDPDTTNKDIAEGFLRRGVRLLGLNEEMKKRIEFILKSSIRKIKNK